LVTPILIPIALGAAIVPTLIGVGVARNEGRAAEQRRVESYAQDVLKRTEATVAQIDDGIRRLTSLVGAGDPCSDEAVDLMRKIDVSSSYIQAIGALQHDKVLCSSLGRETANIDLGPIDLTTTAGVAVRLDVSFPFSVGDRFLVVERDGYAAIVHRDLPIDITVPGDGVAVATFLTPNGEVLIRRGDITPEWTLRPNSSFESNGRVVAVALSDEFHIGALASISDEHVAGATRRAALLFLPMGILAGAAVAAALVQIARSRTALPAMLRSAFRRHEMSLVYQPVVDLKSGAWTGAEVLLRWRRNGEYVRPDLFIPSVEDAGLSCQLTRHVVELLTREAAGLFERRPDLRLAINLTPDDLASSETPDLLTRLVRDLGGTPNNLVVEATERGLLRPDDVIPILDELRRLGVRLAVDDFGTGYASLAYLERFHLDELKIDKLFVDTIGLATPTSGVVHHIIGMAQSLSLEMVAEGVETTTQCETLRVAGVQLAQGYLFARPLTYPDFVSGLEQNAHLEAVARAAAGVAEQWQ
jgi:sensor c-di-GMP phosphodiesterase-like protein